MKKVFLVTFVLLVSASASALQPFELPQMNGERVGQIYQSSSYPNAIFVFEAYFNRCPYCRQNAPIIDQLAAEFQSESRVQVLDLGRDCREADYQSWISRHNPNHPVLKDCDQQVLAPMGVSAFPTTVIYNCRGQEIYRNVGTMESAAYSQAVAVIQAALTETCL